MPWMPFWVADWLSDLKVRAMNVCARGVYIDLLAYQWREGSVPGDPKLVCRLTGCKPSEAREALTFFDPVEGRPGQVHNARLEAVRLEQIEMSLSNHKRAKHAADTRWGKKGPKAASPGHAPGMPGDCYSDSDSDSDPISRPSTAVAPRERELAADSFFAQQFWPLYPRKVSKKTAKRAFRKVHPDEWAAVLEDVKARIARDDQWRERQYVPHASTYLNQERWRDEWDAKGALPHGCRYCDARFETATAKAYHEENNCSDARRRRGKEDGDGA